MAEDDASMPALGTFGNWKLPPRGVDPWSKVGIETQLGRISGVGLLSPRFVPYRPVGMPDLVRDRSLLPKKYQIYKGGYQEMIKPTLFDVVKDEGNHVVLPLRVKGCQWNGERWCGASFSPRVSRSTNGSSLLQTLLFKSERRLRRSRVGEYFLQEALPQKQKKPPKKSPVPRLMLSEVMKFDVSREASKNLELMHEYRMESRRVASERSHRGDQKEQTVTGMPAKALEEYSIQQLGSILSKDVGFTALQQKHNKQLYQFCDSSDTLRPFTFRRKYAALKDVHTANLAEDPNPAATMARAGYFLKGLAQHPWYKDLARVAFAGNRNPSRGEWFILNRLRQIVEAGAGTFGVMDFVGLLYDARKEGFDMNEAGIGRSLQFLRRALKVPDIALEGFVKSCEEVPEWLLELYHPRYGRLVSFRRPTAMINTSKMFTL